MRLAPDPVQTYSLAFRVSNGEFLLTTIFSRLLLLPPFSALSGEALLQILQLDVNTSVYVRSLCPLNQLIVEGGILLVHKRLVRSTIKSKLLECFILLSFVTEFVTAFCF